MNSGNVKFTEFLQGPVKEIVTVMSEKDITAEFEATTENIIRETTKVATLTITE